MDPRAQGAEEGRNPNPFNASQTPTFRWQRRLTHTSPLRFGGRQADFARLTEAYDTMTASATEGGKKIKKLFGIEKGAW